MTFFSKNPTRSAKRGIGFFAFLTFASGFIALASLPTPYLIERPGPAYNVLGTIAGEDVIQIQDQETFDSEGALDVLTVSIVGTPEQTPSWLELALAYLDGAQKVVPIEALYPPGQSTEEVKAESSALMEVSQQDAIAAALLELGYEVPRAVYISEVASDSPSSGKLVAGDFVTAVSGTKVTDIEQLRDLVGKWNESDPLKVSVLRSGTSKEYEISPYKDDEGKYRLGIVVGYTYDFPFEVKLQLGDVGGPSGGMMFALGIIDRLTPGDLTGGKHVAGTGTISPSGEVGPIGGIVQKMYGAKRAGAELFLAPAANCSEVVGNEPDGMRVVKIVTLKDALRALESFASGQDMAALPTCTK
ncbi:MAG: PDZ domain-containing protein [Actinomycetota bacterium]